jgi:hypothetical protein
MQSVGWALELRESMKVPSKELTQSYGTWLYPEG